MRALKNLILSALAVGALSATAQNVTIKLQGKAPMTYPAASVEYIRFDDNDPEQGDVYNILTPEIMPDAALRAAIVDRLGLEEEYYTNVQAAAFAGYLVLQQGEFSSLKGLEYFSALPYLSFDQCTNIDFSTMPVMPSVTSIGFPFCSLSEVNVFDNFPNATKLIISGNKIKSYAPVSDKLQYLICDQNGMESLDISGCPNLVELTASVNNLTSLNLGTAPLKELILKENTAIGAVNFDHVRSSLVFLNVANTGITSLDLHDCINLEELECQDNQLSEVPSFDGCTKLKRIRMEHIGATSVDVSSLSALEELNCYGNQITSLDLSNLSNLWNVNTYSCPITEVNLDGCTSLYRISLSDTKLEKVDLSNCSGNGLAMFICEYTPTLKEVKVWQSFDITNPPATWFIQEGARYVHEWGEEPGEGGGETPENPDKDSYTVKFNFTEPGTEDCVSLTANFSPVDQPITSEFEFAKGTVIAVVQNYEYTIDRVVLNGETIAFAGSKYLSLDKDLEFTITAHPAEKVSTSLTIDNAAAVTFAIEGETVELVDGENTIKFFERKNEATIVANPGYKITSLKVGGWGYWIEEDGPTTLSLSESDTIEVVTEAI